MKKDNIVEIKRNIALLEGVSDSNKYLYWFLLDQSAFLTRNVAVSLTEDVHGYNSEEIRILGHMFDIRVASDAFAKSTSGMQFSAHYGRFVEGGEFNTDGMFPGVPVKKVLKLSHVLMDVPMSHTFWLADEHYSRNVFVLNTSRAELESVDLENPEIGARMQA